MLQPVEKIFAIALSHVNDLLAESQITTPTRKKKNRKNAKISVAEQYKQQILMTIQVNLQGLHDQLETYISGGGSSTDPGAEDVPTIEDVLKALAGTIRFVF